MGEFFHGRRLLQESPLQLVREMGEGELGWRSEEIEVIVLLHKIVRTNVGEAAAPCGVYQVPGAVYIHRVPGVVDREATIGAVGCAAGIAIN